MRARSTTFIRPTRVTIAVDSDIVWAKVDHLPSSIQSTIDVSAFVRAVSVQVHEFTTVDERLPSACRGKHETFGISLQGSRLERTADTPRAKSLAPTIEA